ncbi:hypothetical protein LTR36_002696 [Oleoguttula mirabilis]|uniref:Endoplasmic reticulum lectin n=1 Tax=Oleoguttula mirabilis TaxID=1507867 RepID=A0AAV9JL65_9PEZI|nr:hypothetical protein LTR36_002696 [Oleoguttula mirabilis]
MKHFLALPALLRTSLLLASASVSSFSVHDDLLAFPQYEVKFTDAYVSELDAQARLHSNDEAPAQVEQYRPQPTPDSDDDDGSNKIPADEQAKLEHEYMVLDNQRYLCSIPQVAKPAAHDASTRNDTLTKHEEAKELARATDRGWELLAGMQGNCVYFISGWWSYRFCYAQGVKQFHQLAPNRGVPVYPPVEDPSVEGFELGNFVPAASDGREKGSGDVEGDDEAVAKGKEQEGDSAVDVSEGAAKAKQRPSGYGELVQRGESRYLVQRMAGGTTCDLTGKERRIEVQFHCNPQTTDRIHLIKETSTCAYLMVIQTPRLCHDVAFLPPQKDQPNAISCAPVLAEEEVEDYEREIQALTNAETAAANVWSAAAALGGTGEDNDDASDDAEYPSDLPTTPHPRHQQQQQIVGDILLGAHARVPAGKKIAKGAIVGGGKETYIETVASSDGKALSTEALAKLGLGDAAAVKKLREELERIAGGQEWKLDVIETPRGREYRGIIGGEEGEGEGEDGGGAEGAKKDGEKKEVGKKDGEKQKGADAGAGAGAGVGADVEDDQGQDGSQEEYFREEL